MNNTTSKFCVDCKWSSNEICQTLRAPEYFNKPCDVVRGVCRGMWFEPKEANTMDDEIRVCEVCEKEFNADPDSTNTICPTCLADDGDIEEKDIIEDLK